MLLKVAINLIKWYKERAESKRAMSKVMIDFLLNTYSISDILENGFPCHLDKAGRPHQVSSGFIRRVMLITQNR